MSEPELSFEDFIVRVLALLSQGRFVATYKFAVLVGLMKVIAENGDEAGHAPGAVMTSDLADAVIAAYWPQTRNWPHGRLTADQPHLQQGQRGQPVKVVDLIRAFRSETVGDAGAPLAKARQVAPSEFAQLRAEVEYKLIEMPIGKLQQVGDTYDGFIYGVSWDMRPTLGQIKNGAFVGTLKLRPGAGQHLLRGAPLLRPLIEHTWGTMVAALNELPDLKLHRFLFGADRVSLAPITPGLRELAEGRCFYCGKPVKKAQVDHFVPWSYHWDDAIENLVYAHDTCNRNKSDNLAAEVHVESWAARQHAQAQDLGALAKDNLWDSHPQATLSIVRSTYLPLKTGHPLWLAGKVFKGAEPACLAAPLSGLATSPTLGVN